MLFVNVTSELYSWADFYFCFYFFLFWVKTYITTAQFGEKKL